MRDHADTIRRIRDGLEALAADRADLLAERQQAQAAVRVKELALRQLRAERQQAIDALRRIAEITRPVDPTSDTYESGRVARAALTDLGERP